MSGHTPGPWKVYRAKNGKIIGIGVDRPNEEDHAVGVTDPGFGLWGDGGERDANANLIAAAPELLDALHDIAAMRTEYANATVKRMADRAVAAIAKAKGTGQNDSKPAFPESIAISPAGDVHRGFPGMMTMRDYFAVHASEEDIHRFSSDELGYDAFKEDLQRRRVMARYSYADAMIAARDGGEK